MFHHPTIPKFDIARLKTDVLNHFVAGEIENERLTNEFHAVAKADIFFDQRRKRYVSVRDSRYPDYNATQIPGTRIVVTEAPRDESDVTKMWQAFVFHQTQPVMQGVVLVESLGNTPLNDSYDYIFNSRSSKVEATHRYLNGMIKFNQDDGRGGKCTRLPAMIAGKANTFCAQSQLTIKHAGKEKVLALTTFSVADNCPLYLDGDVDNDVKEEIWRLHRQLQHEPLFIHCRAGVGRTGMMALILCVLDEYEKIFAALNPKLNADTVLEIIRNMRTVRPGLVWNHEQCAQALEVAYQVYRFALERKYICQKEVSPELR